MEDNTKLILDLDGVIINATLAEFIQVNEFSVEETQEIYATLVRHETYVGGGGASPIFTVSLA